MHGFNIEDVFIGEKAKYRVGLNNKKNPIDISNAKPP